MFCSKCGKEIEQDVQFCIHCGNKVNFPSSTENCGSKVDLSSSTKKSNSRIKKIAKMELIIFLSFILFIAIMIAYSSLVNRNTPSKENINPNSSIETEEEKQKRLLEEQKRKEEEEKISSVIKEWASYVRDANQGSVKYTRYSYYATSNAGEKIYKIEYDTGDRVKNDRFYYCQLVTITDDLKNIKKSTKLYFFHEYEGKLISNQKDEMEWEAEKIWGI